MPTQPLHLGLDLLFLLPGSAGLETYSRELVPALLEHEPTLTITAFVSDTYRELDWAFDQAVRVVEVRGGSIRNRYRWTLQELLLLPRVVGREKVALLHSLGSFAPLHGRFRRVVTVHDPPRFHLRSKHIAWPIRAGTATMVSLGARRAHRVITDSQTVQRALVASGIAPGLIDAVFPGVVTPRALLPEVSSGLARRLRLGQRSVALTVGTNLPHKNLATLVRAIARISAASRPVFVFAGRDTDSRELSALVAREGVSKDVRLLGRVSADELESLYALADFAVLPTLHEGFGLPTIEAMMRSVPVACSKIDTMQEVAGQAAIYFDPQRAAEIAAAVEQLARDSALRERLTLLGRERAVRFSWRAAAQGTLSSYRRAMSG